MNWKFKVLLISILISGAMIFSFSDSGENEASFVFEEGTNTQNTSDQKQTNVDEVKADLSQSELNKYREIKNAEEDLRGLKLDISKSKKALDERAKKELEALDDPDEALEEANDLLARLESEGITIIEPAINSASSLSSERTRGILRLNEETQARLMEIEHRFKNMGNNK